MVQSQVEKVPEKVWEKVPEKVCQALVQSQVRLNPEKVPEKVPLVQSQVRFNRVSEKVPRKSGKLAEKVPEKFVFPPFFVFVHVHASERSVKINVAAVGGTTEAYFWLFSFARKVS